MIYSDLVGCTRVRSGMVGAFINRTHREKNKGHKVGFQPIPNIPCHVPNLSKRAPAGNTDPIAERCTPLAAGQIFTEGNEDNEGVFRLSYPRLLLLQFGLLGDFRQQPNGSFRQAEAKPEPQRADEP